MFCKTKQKHFEQYDYISVAWSGDKLPICPYCKQTPYDTDYDDFHETKQGGAG